MRYFVERTFQMSTTIFHYGLTPYEMAVYSYLVSCSGNQSACQAKIKTIATACGCSDSTTRRALHELQRKGFIDIKGNIQCLKSGGGIARPAIITICWIAANGDRPTAHDQPSPVTGEMYKSKGRHKF